jgi:hypothetical protein
MIQVIKIGGGILENEVSRQMFLQQFAAVDGPKVLVHGGGRLATTMAERLGVAQQMIDGRRVTDKETLDIVTMVYGGLVNKQLVASLQNMGINAIGLTGADGGWMKAVKRPVKNGIDYGFVGDITEVRGDVLRMLLDEGMTPEDMLKKVLDGMDVEFTDTLPVEFNCNCTKERVEKALVSVGEKDLKDMIADGKPIEVNCHFCNKNYSFTIAELQEMLKRAKRK